MLGLPGSRDSGVILQVGSSLVSLDHHLRKGRKIRGLGTWGEAGLQLCSQQGPQPAPQLNSAASMAL